MKALLCPVKRVGDGRDELNFTMNLVKGLTAKGCSCQKQSLICSTGRRMCHSAWEGLQIVVFSDR